MDSTGEGARPRGWVRLIGEVVVIVLGIAIALGADAWWDYRQEREYELLSLRQLASEFAANAAQFDSVLAHHQLVEDASLVLISAGTTSVPLPTDSIRLLLSHVDTWWTFNPKSGALGSVLSSGGLRMIRNDSLRIELAGWPGLVEDFQENEIQAVEYAMGLWSEVLYQKRGLTTEIYFPAGDDVLLQSLLRDREFRDAVVGRWAFFPDLLEEAESVRGTLARIRGVIDEELSRSDGGN